MAFLNKTPILDYKDNSVRHCVIKHVAISYCPSSNKYETDFSFMAVKIVSVH